MAVRVQSEFKTLKGDYYLIEVHDSDYVGSALTSFECVGFEVSWEEESDDFLEPLKRSSCTFTLRNDLSSDFNSFRGDIATGHEDEFKLVINKYNGVSWDLWWCGVILTDLITWQNTSPKGDFVITAKDGLSRLSQLKFDNVFSAPFDAGAQTFMYIVERILNKNGLATFHASVDYIKVSIDWNEVSQSLSAPQRVLEYVSIWGDLLKEYNEADKAPKADTQSFTCEYVLSSLLRLFAARILYSEGCYHIQQVSNFTTDTYDEAVYNNSGVYDSVNTSVSIKESTGANLVPMAGASFGYHPPYRSCKLTAKGYLDVKGAYIDNQIVDSSDTSWTDTLLLGDILGNAGTHATETILAADNSAGVNIDLRAYRMGTGGNSITFTGDGTTKLNDQIITWNLANPQNPVYFATTADKAYSNAIVDNAVVVQLAGGTGSYTGQRKLEIDFDLSSTFTISEAQASNLQVKVDLKLICGSYRIKNGSSSPSSQGYYIPVWTTTAADKFSYVIKCNDIFTHKVSVVALDIPFEKEEDCTLEVTLTLQRNNVAVAWPDKDALWGTLSALRVILWDNERYILGDQEVRVDNPTSSVNSIEYDFGNILIGDDPTVQTSISSKNYLIVDNGSGVNTRSNAWDASFDADYGLVRTMLFEAMSLRRTPTEKYMGSLYGTYAAHKSLGYDSGRWVMNSVRYNAEMDEWEGVWWKINYSQADITVSNERLLPPPLGLQPYQKVINPAERVPIPINPKGKGAIPYEQGIYIDAIEVDALDNKHFRQGDSLMVYHPDSKSLLHEFVVDADTTVSDTEIQVVGDTADYDIVFGAVLEHNSKEVIESTNVRSDNFVYLGASWSKTVYITESDFTTSVYQLDGTEGITLVNISGGGLYYVDLPLISDSVKNGCGLDLIVKHLAGAFEVRVPASDSGVYIKTTQSSTLTSLAVTGGASLRLVYDVANHHWQRISI